MKKRLLSLLFVLALCMLAALPCHASDGGFVFDLEGVVRETDALNSEAREIYDETGIALYFIYTEDLNGLESEDFAAQFALAHGFFADRVILMEGPTSYYICVEGALQERVTQDDLAAMRDAYVADDTYEGGVRVIANYSADPYECEDGTAEAGSWLLVKEGGSL